MTSKEVMSSSYLNPHTDITQKQKPHYSPTASSAGKGHQCPLGNAKYDAAREGKVTNDYFPIQSISISPFARLGLTSRDIQYQNRERTFRFYFIECFRGEDAFIRIDHSHTQSVPILPILNLTNQSLIMITALDNFHQSLSVKDSKDSNKLTTMDKILINREAK